MHCTPTHVFPVLLRGPADALSGLRELLLAHPQAVRESTATVLDRVGARLCDLDKKVREAARAVLQDALFPALPSDVSSPTLAAAPGPMQRQSCTTPSHAVVSFALQC